MQPHKTSIGYFKDKAHYFPTRVYYYNTDAGGVVYHGRYLDICEMARTEMLDSTSKESAKKDMEEVAQTVVRSLSVEYKKPAFLYDEIVIRTEIIGLTGASMKIRQIVMKGNEELVVVNLTIVFVDLKKMAPCRIPENMRKKLEQFLQDKR